MMMMLEFRNAKITTACYYFRKYDMLVIFDIVIYGMILYA